MPRSNPRVVIIGAGFGGLEATKTLRRAPVEIILIDRRNYHCFQPPLYQVATAALSPADIAWPIRHILRRQKNATGRAMPNGIPTRGTSEAPNGHPEGEFSKNFSEDHNGTKNTGCCKANE